MRTKIVERSILHYTNKERRKRKLTVLAGQPALITAARSHSRWMANTGRYGHTGANGNSPSNRASEAGYFGGASENIWQVQSDHGRGGAWMSRFRWDNDWKLGKAAVISWMNSPGHRANMLSYEWHHIGIGVAINKRGRIYLTQNFGNGPFDERLSSLPAMFLKNFASLGRFLISGALRPLAAIFHTSPSAQSRNNEQQRQPPKKFRRPMRHATKARRR